MRDKLPNPPAFPVGPGSTAGMTIRDYFAAAALPGLIPIMMGSAHAINDSTIAKGVAEASYAIADAMLEARTQ